MPVSPSNPVSPSYETFHNSNQSHLTFLMTSSCFNAVIEVKNFYEEIKLSI